MRAVPVLFLLGASCAMPSFDTAFDTGPEMARSCGTGAYLGGGAGTAADPWLVCASDELGALVREPAGHFRLGRDLVLEEPLVGFGQDFAGVLDGNGHRLTGLTLRDEYAGVSLFANVSGAVFDLELDRVDVSGGQFTAVLARHLTGRVEGLRVSGQVRGHDGFLGGVIGTVGEGGLLRDVHTELEVRDSSDLGFVGGVFMANYGRAEQLVANNRVDAGIAWKVGGIGVMSAGSVDGCVFRGEVSGGTRVAGVLAVNMGGAIRDCLSAGEVHGEHWVGGIVGESYGGEGGSVERTLSVSPLSSRIAHRGHAEGGIVAWMPYELVADDAFYLAESESVVGQGISAASLRDGESEVRRALGGPWRFDQAGRPSLSFE